MGEIVLQGDGFLASARFFSVMSRRIPEVPDDFALAVAGISEAVNETWTSCPSLAQPPGPILDNRGSPRHSCLDDRRRL